MRAARKELLEEMAQTREGEPLKYVLQVSAQGLREAGVKASEGPRALR